MLRVSTRSVARPPSKTIANLANIKNTDRKYSTDENVPKQADVVIIGGGIIGSSTFYHLTKRGIKPILLERSKITSGTTWHTGGIIWSLRPNDTDTQMLQKTRQLLRNLEKDTGEYPGWTNTGGIFIARNSERLEEYKRLHTLGHFFNVDSQLLSPRDAKKICEILDPKAFYGALYSPEDGFVDPTNYCNALVKGGKNNGGEVYENVTVTGLNTDTTKQGLKKIVSIETSKGTIKTGLVVNTTGAWARDITQMVGLDIPIVSMKHSYAITNNVVGAKTSPCVRDHDGGLYFRRQGESILFGGYEPNPEILKDLPNEEFKLFDLDFSVFEIIWKNLCELCPTLEKAGLKTNICGVESFTADHKPVMGEDPRVIGLFHGAGFNSLGIQLSGGAGDQLSHWVAKGRPELDMHAYDIRRFTPAQRSDRAWATETAHEAYATSYSIVYPKDQKLAGRNHRIDPFHEHMVASGAVMEQVLNWERPSFFIKEDRTAPVRGYDWGGYYDHVKNVDQRYIKELEGDYTFDFSKHFENIKEEALASRNNVALFNLSSYCKMYLTGPDAEEACDWLFTTDLGKEPGKVTYTCSLNSRGGVEADVTATVLEEGGGTLVGPILKGKGYYIVAGGASGYQTISHLRKQMFIKGYKSLITETTDKLGILSIQGPKSGELLQSITESPITDDRFPLGMSHIIKIGGHICRAMRISYVGELGYELHIPTAFCVAIYNKVIEAGRGFDLKLSGFRALDSLGAEKGYHILNQDLRIDDNPVEAGLLRLCRKDGQYQGKSVIEKVKQEGLKKQRVFFTLQDHVNLLGYETIWRDDSIVGYLRRGDYAFSLDCPIGIGYVVHPKGKVVDSEFLKSGDYHIEVRNKKYPATLFTKSPFDPKNQRLLGRYEANFQEQSHFED